MELGTRSIRSAGRGSGSIEITLPSRLRALDGLVCQVSWHEAPVPHIRLAPDLRAARAALLRLWLLLLPALGRPATEMPALDIGMAPSADLLWDDALALTRQAPHEAMVVSRTLGALAALIEPRPAAFAPCLAFLATGSITGAEYRDDCAIAAAALTTRAAAPLDGFGDVLFQTLARQAGPLLALQQALGQSPARHAALRAAARAGDPLDLQGLLP